MKRYTDTETGDVYSLEQLQQGFTQNIRFIVASFGNITFDEWMDYKTLIGELEEV